MGNCVDMDTCFWISELVASDGHLHSALSSDVVFKGGGALRKSWGWDNGSSFEADEGCIYVDPPPKHYGGRTFWLWQSERASFGTVRRMNQIIIIMS